MYEIFKKKEESEKKEEFLKKLHDAVENQDNSKQVYRGRLVLLGASGVGKTSTKRSLFDERFQKKYESTDGADIFGIDITDWVIKGSRNEEYHGKRSTKKTREMMEDAVISGLKCQTEERHLKTANRSTRSQKENISLAEDLKEEGEDILKLADRLKERVKFAEDTSVPDLDFSLWDFAGQFVYYITHQVFLTSKVVYMLVTDLTKALEESTKIMLSELSVQEQVLPNEWKVKDFLSFWMNLIHTQGASDVTVHKKGRKVVKSQYCSPPVIIVGTKKDLLDDPENESKKRLKEIKEYLRRTVPAASQHIVGMIALDNKSRKDGTASDLEVKRLREMIKREAMEHFNIGNIPVKWLQLELALKKWKEETMPLSKAYEIGKEINLTDDEVGKALCFFHSVGEILHFDMMPETRDMIILNVGWLVGLFKILITQSLASKDDIDAPPMLHHMTDELYQHGRLHEDLVDHVLKCNRRLSDKAVLLATMKQFDILCEKPSEVNRGNRDVYYLPWLHQSACDTGEDIIQPAGSTLSCSLYFHFRGNFLPDGLFYRLIVRCLRQWPRATELVKHRIRILVDSVKDLHLIISKEGSDVTLTGLTLRSKEILPAALSTMRIFVEEALEGLVGVYFPSLADQYQVSLKCQCERHSDKGAMPWAQDDRCSPVETGSLAEGGQVRVYCEQSVQTFDRPEANVWYDNK